tara:strand:- start:1240 stop:1809 length:570 start_codon:yes stop_codon:yes gene_type:complete
MTDRKESKNCCLCISSVLATIFGLFVLLFVLLPLLTYYNFVEGSCNIINVTYPTELPTPGDTSLWSECDCGKNCMALSPCVNVFVDISNNTYMVHSGSSWAHTSSTDICSFHNSTCSDGENVMSLYEYIEWAEDFAKIYTDDMNSTQSCYKFNDYVYLSNEIPIVTIIMLSSIFGILLLASIYMCISKN